MAQEALGFMQNSKEKNLDFIEILSKEPDNILSLDVSSVKTLQIGYQAVELAVKAANGEEVSDVDTGALWYTADNIDDEEIAACLYE